MANAQNHSIVSLYLSLDHCVGFFECVLWFLFSWSVLVNFLYYFTGLFLQQQTIFARIKIETQLNWPTTQIGSTVKKSEYINGSLDAYNVNSNTTFSFYEWWNICKWKTASANSRSKTEVQWRNWGNCKQVAGIV